MPTITIRPPSQAARAFMPLSVVGSPFSYTTVDAPVVLTPNPADYSGSNLYLKQDLTAITVGGVTWPIDEVIYVPEVTTWTCMLVFKAAAKYYIVALDYTDFTMASASLPTSSYMFLVTTVIPTGPAPMPSPAWPGFMPATKPAGGSTPSWPQATAGSTVLLMTVPTYLAPAIYAGQNHPATWYKPAATNAAPPPVPAHNIVLPPVPPPAQTAAGTVMLEIPTPEMTAYLDASKYMPIYASHQGGSFAIDYPTLTLTASMSKVDEIIYVQVGAGAGAQWTCLLSLKPPNALPTIRAVNEQYMSSILYAYIQPAKVAGLGIMVTTIIPKGVAKTPPAWPGLFVPPSTTNTLSVLPPAASGTVVASSVQRYIAEGKYGASPISGYYYAPATATAPLVQPTPVVAAIPDAPIAAGSGIAMLEIPTPEMTAYLETGKYMPIYASHQGGSFAIDYPTLTLTASSSKVDEIIYVPVGTGANAKWTCLLSLKAPNALPTIRAANERYMSIFRDYIQPAKVTQLGIMVTTIIPNGIVLPALPAWPGIFVPTSNGGAGSVLPPAALGTVVAPSTQRYIAEGKYGTSPISAYHYAPSAATAPVLPFVPLTITISPPSARANMLINDTPTVPSTVLTLGSGNYSGSGYSLAPLALALSVTSKIYSLQEIVYVPNDPASAGSTCLLSFSSTIDGSRLVFSLTAQDYARVMPTVPSPNVTYSTVVGGVPDVSIWPGFHVPTSNDVAVAEPTPAGILRPTVARYYVTGSGAGTFYDPKALPCVALTACMSTLGSSLLECAAHAKACTLPASATVAARFQIDKTDIGLYALGPLALFGTSTDTIVVVKPTGINKASVLLIEKTKGAATTLSATLSGNVWTDDVTAAALRVAQTKTASEKAASDAQQSKTASDLDISNPQKLNAASEAQKIADAAAKTAQDAANVLTEVTAALAKTKQQQMDAQAALTATQNEKARLDKSNAQLQKDAADAKKTFDDAKTDFEKWNLAAATAQSGAADLLATTKQLNVAALAALAKTLGENAGLDRANVDLQKAAADAKKAADDAKAELDKVQKTATDIRAAVAQLAGQQKATDPVPASCTTLGTCLVAAGLGDLTTCAPQARACSPGTPASETLTFRGVSIPLYTVNGSPARYGKDATSIYVLQPGTVATTGTLLVVPVVTGASTVYAATLASAVWSVRPDAPGTSVPAGTDAPKPGKGFWTPLNIGLIVGGGVLFLVLLFALLMYKNDAPTNRIFPVKSG